MPLDGSTIQVSAVGRTLMEAAKKCRNGHWYSCDAKGPKPLHGNCAFNLIHQIGGHEAGWPTVAALAQYLDVGPLGLIYWNDAPGRTAEEVAAAMESCALSLKE